jgi:dTDP-D-glucose 4,6-dehydratase
MLNEIIKKLRKAADALDELLETEPKHNKAVVTAIHKSIDKQIKERKKYKKYVHWTKKRNGKAKMRKAVLKRKAKE